ncbi:AraC family transcriptional regulator [Parafrankia discariae]|uniref:AraC family transcriptional regulator n=1 Tax=Parafrankia discariae TaxID=365528 RepID=UPI00037D8470|nr:AraC family transcriptional regulator [Parafrankia discariae]
MDLLADVLAVSGVRGTVAARIRAGSSWGWWARDVRGAAFHAVTAGTAWLGLPGQPPRELLPGDVVLLPTGTEHLLAGDERIAARGGDHRSDSWERAGDGTVRIGVGPVRTHILCAHYTHDPAVTTQVLGLLPEIVHIRGCPGGTGLDDTVRLLGRELADPRIGGAVVLDRLVDVLLVQLLRVWLAGAPDRPRTSWLGALGDPVVAAALRELHADPARAWTTASLAGVVVVSRATLARRFAAALGQSPGVYLTRWRMDLAALRLRDTEESLDVVARSVGYSSVYAFSRAFRRARGAPPGRYRQTARGSGTGSRRWHGGVEQGAAGLARRGLVLPPE